MAETTSVMQVGSPEWLEERRSGIGGSEAAAVLGISRYTSRMRVYLNKIGQETPEVDNDYIKWGNILEPVIRNQFAAEYNVEVEINEEMLRSEKHPFMVAHLDGIIHDPKKKTPGVLEVKNVTEWKKGEWENGESPAEYIVQIQHNMEVAGLMWGYLVALIGGNRLVANYIEKDEELVKQIIEAEEEFWNENVIPRKMPPFDASSDSEVILKALYPEAHEPDVIDLPPLIDNDLDEWQVICDQIKDLEKRKEEIENKAKAELGEYEKGRTEYRLVKWTNVYTTDEQRLAEEHPEILERYQKTSFDKAAFKANEKELYDKYKTVSYRKFGVKEVVK